MQSSKPDPLSKRGNLPACRMASHSKRPREIVDEEEEPPIVLNQQDKDLLIDSADPFIKRLAALPGGPQKREPILVRPEVPAVGFTPRGVEQSIYDKNFWFKSNCYQLANLRVRRSVFNSKRSGNLTHNIAICYAGESLEHQFVGQVRFGLNDLDPLITALQELKAEIEAY